METMSNEQYQNFLLDQQRVASEYLERELEKTPAIVLWVFSLFMPEVLQRTGYRDGLYPRPKPAILQKVYQLP
jgi:hypothetical protein